VVSDGEELWEILIGDNGVDGEILLGGVSDWWRHL